MTLHAAIQQVLLKAGKPLSATEIVIILNKNSWYTKGDGIGIKSSQISARVKNYPHLFSKANGLITLKSKTGVRPLKNKQTPLKTPLENVNQDSSLSIKILMNEKNFKKPLDGEHKIPDSPGLYCIRIKDVSVLGKTFSNILKLRDHNIIYIGIASKSLKKRFLNQELRAKGHGTFFRSLGAVLGYIPDKGSLIGKSNQNNYKFSKKDEIKIIDWINENLLINWVTLSENLSRIENELIKEYLPLLNIAGNPEALKEVRDLRNKCKEIARGTL